MIPSETTCQWILLLLHACAGAPEQLLNRLLASPRYRLMMPDDSYYKIFELAGSERYALASRSANCLEA